MSRGAGSVGAADLTPRARPRPARTSWRGRMPDPGRTLLVGAVAYHPRVVTVWEGFRPYFAERGLDVDYVLYSNYERLVAALVAGHIDLAWNTNTAYVCAQERLGGEAVVLGMRDVDDGYVSVLVAREGVRIPA